MMLDLVLETKQELARVGSAESTFPKQPVEAGGLQENTDLPGVTGRQGCRALGPAGEEKGVEQECMAGGGAEEGVRS